MNVFVCTACSDTASALIDALQGALPDAQVRGIDCMSGCTRAQTVAVRSPGKVAYLFGDITAADLPDITRFAALYANSPDGAFDDARPLGGLRHKALARIPG